MPGLAQILGDGPQDRDFPSGETACEDEPVEPVVLDIAAPHAEEASWKRSRTGSSSCAPSAGRSRRSTTRLRPTGRDLVGTLIDDLGPHVLERRQHVGERHAAGAEELAADEAFVAVDG